MSEPVIVAGGGLAGAAAAAELASHGLPVMVIERETAPAHKICGEFLSVEAQESLRRIGFPLASLGGHPITRLRLARGAEAVTAALPFPGLGVTRRALDQALLGFAASRGAEIVTGQAVRSIDGSGVTFGGGTRASRAILLATGKHDLRGMRRAAEPEDLVGFKMYFGLGAKARAALAGTVEIILFSDSYAGLQLVEDGSANLCLLASGARLRDAGGTWEALLDGLMRESPHLASRLGAAAPLLGRPLAISRVPYGFLHRADPRDPPGLYRLGDQAGVIPSFAGDGMAIALHSAAAAAQACLRGEEAASYHRRLRRDIAGQIGRAGALYRLGRSPLGQRILFALARNYAPVLPMAARLTRVPRRARLGLQVKGVLS